MLLVALCLPPVPFFSVAAFCLLPKMLFVVVAAVLLLSTALLLLLLLAAAVWFSLVPFFASGTTFDSGNAFFSLNLYDSFVHIPQYFFLSFQFFAAAAAAATATFLACRTVALSIQTFCLFCFSTNMAESNVNVLLSAHLRLITVSYWLKMLYC